MPRPNNVDYGIGVTNVASRIIVARQRSEYSVIGGALANHQPSYLGGSLTGASKLESVLRFPASITNSFVMTDGYDDANISGRWLQNNTIGNTALRAYLSPRFRDFTIDGEWGALDPVANGYRCDAIRAKSAGALFESLLFFNIPGYAIVLKAVDSTAAAGFPSIFDDLRNIISNVTVKHSWGGVVVYQDGTQIDGLQLHDVYGVGLAIRGDNVRAKVTGGWSSGPTSPTLVSVPTTVTGCTVTIEGSGDGGTVLDLSASGLDTTNGGGNRFVVHWSGTATKVKYPGGGTAFNLAPGTEVVINDEIQSAVDVVGCSSLTENSAAAAAANAVALQSLVDAGAPVKKWFLRGGSGDTKPYYVDRTIRLHGIGRSWEGLGRHAWATGTADYSSILLLSADDHATTFNGAAKTATAASGGNVLTVVGRTVIAADKYNSLYISGGTNFVAGWYTITNTNAGANQWTLDRVCTSGGAASVMTGYYCPALIQNAGAGHRHVGLNFEAKKNNAATLRGAVGYHVVTGSQVNPPGNYITGQHYFESCSFMNFDHALLCGAGMAEYGEKSSEYYGYHDNFADTITLHHCTFYNVVDAVVARNYQSVVHHATAVHAYLSGSLYRFDAGGKLFAKGVELAGHAGYQRILTLGGAISSNNGVYDVRGFSFDGATRNPQLIVTEFDNITYNVLVSATFDGGNLARGTTNDGLYLVDIQSCVTLTLRNIQGTAAMGGIWAGSIRLRKGPVETPYGNSPLVFIENCQLAVSSLQTEVIDNANCDAGIRVVFRGCHNGRGTLYNDQVLTTG